MKGTNIQVNGNVYGGIHVNARGAALSTERPAYTPGLAVTSSVVLLRIGQLIKAIAMLAGGALLLAAWLTFGALALAVWVLGRASNVVLWIESRLGGAPDQLVYVPSIMQPRNQHQLGPGNPHQLANIHTRETDYVDSN